MKRVLVSLQSLSAYSQSRKHDIPMVNAKEPWDDYEARTWRERSTYDPDKTIVIPAMAFKQSLDAGAKMLSESIPGKGKATFTKHFLSGVVCDADVPIPPHTRDNVPSVTINANSDGVRGSGKRVRRTYPIIAQWDGEASFTILDDTVTEAVFERTLKAAGMTIGIGRFRPQNGGLNGRFRPVRFAWTKGLD